MTDKQISDIIGSIVILVDTREQKYDHVTGYLDSIGITWEKRKLDSGDYSFYIKDYPELSESIIIERKNSWDEITGNFTKGRKRFENEFERIPEGVDVHLVIENATWTKLFNGSYRSKMPPQSLMASLMTFSARYDLKVWTGRTQDSPVLIYNIIKYGVREKLKKS